MSIVLKRTNGRDVSKEVGTLNGSNFAILRIVVEGDKRGRVKGRMKREIGER